MSGINRIEVDEFWADSTIIRPVRKPLVAAQPLFPSGLCEFFQAKALQKLSFIWKLFGKLKFPNSSNMFCLKLRKKFIKVVIIGFFERAQKQPFSLYFFHTSPSIFPKRHGFIFHRNLSDRETVFRQFLLIFEKGMVYRKACDFFNLSVCQLETVSSVFFYPFP